jgi:HAD superfamily hydrolase (TIGR01490 family)
MRLAIFDVDGTLIKGKSTEKRFFGWLLRHGYLGSRQWLSAAWFVARWLPKFGRHVFRKNKAYLDGLRASLVAEAARQFVDAMPDSEWNQPALAELAQHKERGDLVVLLSGTLQPILERLSDRFGADGCLGTECKVEHDLCTAQPPIRHPFHEEKATLLSSICATRGIGAAEVSAYGDSHFDIPMLSMAGQPIAVCPDRKLAAWARSKGHRILK